jgi:CDP-paratose 2-epimerase
MKQAFNGSSKQHLMSNSKEGPSAINTAQSQGYVLVLGGAGFIGSNLAHRLMAQGQRVLIFDSLARPGVEKNLRWLQQKYPDQIRVHIADVRNREAIDEAVRRATAVYHLAAQVAVTTSIADPIEDFEINARGTLNLLEALRVQRKKIPLLFTSTNKVYGDLMDVQLGENDFCYYPSDTQIQQQGISEARPLAFHSPYGCSKGAADQYVLDYAHTYGIPAMVFRMSCIYGPHQFGTEDQGWVAHFLIRALQGHPLTLYGDGKQVRDILFVDDLINAMQLAHKHIDRTAGQAFNIGGGPSNTLSLLQLLNLIEKIQGEPVAHNFDEWRRGDQRYYVSDTNKFEQVTGWRAQVTVEEGLIRLFDWLQSIQAQDRAKATPASATVATPQRKTAVDPNRRKANYTPPGQISVEGGHRYGH